MSGVNSTSPVTYGNTTFPVGTTISKEQVMYRSERLDLYPERIENDQATVATATLPNGVEITVFKNSSFNASSGGLGGVVSIDNNGATHLNNVDFCHLQGTDGNDEIHVVDGKTNEYRVTRKERLINLGKGDDTLVTNPEYGKINEGHCTTQIIGTGKLTLAGGFMHTSIFNLGEVDATKALKPDHLLDLKRPFDVINGTVPKK